MGLTVWRPFWPSGPRCCSRYSRDRRRISGGTSGADPTALSTDPRQEREHALAEVNKLCEETLDLSFDALALGQEPPAYDGRCPFLGSYPFRQKALAYLARAVHPSSQDRAAADRIFSLLADRKVPPTRERADNIARAHHSYPLHAG